MLLAIDIGNTHVDIGLFDADRLRAHRKWPTRRDATAEAYAPAMEELLQQPVETALVASVVADLGPAFVHLCRRHCLRAHLVDSSWDLGLGIEYDDPAHVGIDRLLAAAAAFARAPEHSGAIVADCGSAITVDLVDGRGVFRGGAIAPGLHLMLRALATGTSLLPAIALDAPPPLVGTSTPDGMRAGVFYGAAALVDGLCQRLGEAVASPLQRALTGGDGALLYPHLRHFDYCEPALVLHGLALAHARRAY